MGYESRLIIVRPTNVCDGVLLPNVYATRYAQFDLGKLDEDFKLILGSNTKYYFFGDDGDARVVRDEYGYPLREINWNDFYSFVCKLQKNDYRRCKLLPVADLIRSIILYHLYDSDCFEDNFVILHYGY